jgi:hypothetical protein
MSMDNPNSVPAAAPAPDATPAPAAPPAAPAPVPDLGAVDGEGFTAAEREFFASKGEKTEGLVAPAEPGAAAAPGTGTPAAAAPAPGAAAPPAPAAGEDDDLDDDAPVDPSKPPPKRVNYQKFKRISDRAKTLEKELGDLRVKSATEHATLAERVRLINEAISTPAQQAKQEEEDPEPDKQVDIFAHNEWLARKTAKLETQLKTISDRETERTSHQTMAETYEADANAFSSTPTLEDGSPNAAAQVVQLQNGGQATNFVLAYFYLLNNRMEELKRYGMTDAAEIKRTVANEERDLVRRAIAAKASPARRVWDMAIGRGFQPIKPSAAPQPAANGAAVPAAAAAPAAAPATLGTPLGAPAAANGAAPPAANGAAPAAAAPSVSDEIARIKSGQSAAFSLSNAAGAAAGTLTPEALANMPQEDFAQVLAGLTKAQQKQLLGA